MLRRRKLALIITLVAAVGLTLAGTAYARSLSALSSDQGAGLDCGGVDMDVMHSTMWPSLATSLGLTTDQLDQALAEGKSLGQIAAEKGISSDQLAEQMLDAMKTALDQQVAQGTLTSEQEEAILDSAKEHMTPEHIAAMGSVTGSMHDGAGFGSDMDSMHRSMHGADSQSDTGTDSGGSCHGDGSGGGTTGGGMMGPGGSMMGQSL